MPTLVIGIVTALLTGVAAYNQQIILATFLAVFRVLLADNKVKAWFRMTFRSMKDRPKAQPAVQETIVPEEKPTDSPIRYSLSSQDLLKAFCKDKGIDYNVGQRRLAEAMMKPYYSMFKSYKVFADGQRQFDVYSPDNQQVQTVTIGPMGALNGDSFTEVKPPECRKVMEP